MFGSLKLEDGQIKLDGYPEGATARGLALPQGTELCRLMLFRNDLALVAEWLRIAGVADIQPLVQEALCSAALVKFCCCFEGTSGLRSLPLRRKNIFRGEDRSVFERLLLIRHRAVAHNEHLYPGEFPLIVLDATATAIEAVVVSLDAPFSGMKEVDDLRRLSAAALNWVMVEFETIAKEIVDSINAISQDERRVLRDSTPEYSIKVGVPEDRFARK